MGRGELLKGPQEVELAQLGSQCDVGAMEDDESPR